MLNAFRETMNAFFFLSKQ